MGYECILRGLLSFSLRSCSLSSVFFAFFLSLCLIFFTLSWSPLSSSCLLTSCSPSPFLYSLSFSLSPPFLPRSFSLALSTPVRCGPHARESRARYNTHGWSAALTRGVCGPTSSAGDPVTWPPGRNGTQRAARAVLSREPRTRHQSETNRETGPTDRTVSPRKRVWCFLPPSLSLSDSFFSLFSPFFVLFFFLCYCLLSFTLPVPLWPGLACVRDISRLWILRATPATFL